MSQIDAGGGESMSAALFEYGCVDWFDYERTAKIASARCSHCRQPMTESAKFDGSPFPEREQTQEKQ